MLIYDRQKHLKESVFLGCNLTSSSSYTHMLHNWTYSLNSYINALLLSLYREAHKAREVLAMAHPLHHFQRCVIVCGRPCSTTLLNVKPSCPKSPFVLIIDSMNCLHALVLTSSLQLAASLAGLRIIRFMGFPDDRRTVVSLWHVHRIAFFFVLLR